MSNVDDNLNKLLEIDKSNILQPEEWSNIPKVDTPITQQSPLLQTPIVMHNADADPEPASPDDSPEITEDYEKSRTALEELLQKGTEALDQLVKVAKASENPRAYEVIGTLIKSLTETTKEMMELHRTRKEVKLLGTEGRGPDPSVNVEKAVFIGRPDELLAYIKELKGNDGK